MTDGRHFLTSLKIIITHFSSGSRAEFGQLGLDQLWCDGHHTGGGVSEGVRRRSVTGEQRCRLAVRLIYSRMQ